ncbi:MAG: RNA polymerase factor sigma-54 [Leptospiraceae bacterium]|nr:RNA polymerase factor sigma-54 [Leptospiraceae bacterium]
MALSQQLVQKQTQKLVMTQDLRQSIELLVMSNVELNERLQKELLENPLLEEGVQPGSEQVGALDKIRDRLEAQSREDYEQSDSASDSGNEGNALEWNRERLNHDRNDAFSQSSYEKTESKHAWLQNAISAPESLQDHLMAQLGDLNLDAADFRVCEILISAIDDNGFLIQDPHDLLTDLGQSADRLSDYLGLIQGLEPCGCGSRGVHEALLVQARQAIPADPVSIDLLANHFDLLEKLDYQRIEKNTGYTSDQIDAALQRISHFEPYPGSRYASLRPDYIVPELSVELHDGELFIVLHDDAIPDLRINAEMQQQLEHGRHNAADQEYIKNKLSAAQWLIHGLEQRKSTLLKTMQSILKFQRDFFLHGPESLRPLTLREVAQDIDMHESTVSRITTAKYVETPWGIVELKYFFDSGVKSQNGNESYSATSIQNRIQQLVAAEDPAQPLADQQIVAELQEHGIKIARRTVAKYRNNLGLLSADQRKRLNRIQKKTTPKIGEK